MRRSLNMFRQFWTAMALFILGKALTLETSNGLTSIGFTYIHFSFYVHPMYILKFLFLKLFLFWSYQHCEQMLNTKPGSQRVDGRTNEADKSSPLKNEGSERILAKQPLRLATKHARNMFFPFWKSVLSARLPVKISPPSCTGPTQSTFQLSFTSNSGLIKMELSATREWLYPAFLQAVLWFILCLKPF